MEVKDVTTVHVPLCSTESSWAVAANALWEYDAGVVVILDSEQRPVGLLTERDICRAVATRSLLPAKPSAADVMSAPPPTCGLDEDVRSALRKMAIHRIRALPVVGPKGTIVGLVTLQRILIRAKENSDLSPEEILKILREVWAEHALPEDAVICGWEHR